MGFLSGIINTASGVVKTGLGVAADVVTLGSGDDSGESYTEKGLDSLGEGLDDLFE